MNFSQLFVTTILVKKYILIINLNVISRVKIETTSASDQNSNMAFLRNEFSEIFENLFTMTLLTDLTHMYEQKKIQLRT